MKAIKTFTIITLFVNLVILSIYQHQFGVKTLTGMIIACAVAGLILYSEARKIKVSWDENERRVLTIKLTELSVAALMTCFAGALFVKIMIHTFI